MKKYAVVYEKAPGNMAAYVPDLPGCITTCSTPDETKRNIREAMAEVGEAIPDPTADVGFVELQIVA